jgi:hypothetical protein
MTQPAIQLRVFRRNGQVFVTAWALSNTGFNALHELIPVQPVRDGLLKALELGEHHARAATERPLKKRFPAGTPYWEQAGCKTYEQFAKGANAISILRDDELTELAYHVPNSRGAFVPIDDAESRELAVALGPGTPMSKVAGAVQQMFETADRRGG